MSEKARFWGRKAPADRFPAQFFIVLPSRRLVEIKIGDFRAVTRIFARIFSFSFAVAPPRSHFYRIFKFERHGSGDPTPCGGYPGTDCWGLCSCLCELCLSRRLILQISLIRNTMAPTNIHTIKMLLSGARNFSLSVISTKLIQFIGLANMARNPRQPTMAKIRKWSRPKRNIPANDE